MTGHNDSERKSSEAGIDLQTFSAENLQSNMKVIYYRLVVQGQLHPRPSKFPWKRAWDACNCAPGLSLSLFGLAIGHGRGNTFLSNFFHGIRTFLSIIGGVIAGILGFTGLIGFVFYFLIMAITSIGLIAKAKFSVHSYFDSWNRIMLDGFFSGLMSFVLFWTFAYDIVHIF